MDLTKWRVGRAAILAQLAVETIFRSVLKSLPLGGSADEIFFGVRDKLQDQALADAVERLQKQVRNLSTRLGQLDGSDVASLLETQVIRELRTRLEELDDAAFAIAESELLAHLSQLPPCPPPNPDETVAALKAILDGERRLREHIATLRGQARLWMEDLHERRDVAKFLAAVRAVRHELSGKFHVRPRQYVDAYVLMSATSDLWHEQAGVAAYFLDRVPTSQVALHPEQIGLMLNWFEGEARQARQARSVGARRLAWLSALSERLTLWEKPQAWTIGAPDRFQVEAAHSLLRELYGQNRYIRERAPFQERALFDNAVVVASTLNSAEVALQNDPLVFVTTRPRLFTVGKRLARSDNPVRMLYGAAWRNHYREEAMGKRIASTFDDLKMLELAESLTASEIRRLAPNIEAFLATVEPFHEAVADYLQAKLDDRLGSFVAWISEVKSGADRFDRLMAFFDEVQVSSASARGR